ncbi:class I SAM-dependent methyltransferase [Desulforhopalus singaporensis]|nr:class I SAM-dependent methyltransferase [Desulforhopalus singaporensis]
MITPKEQSVVDHYTNGELLKAVEGAVGLLGKNETTISAKELAPVDEFHVGGRIATDNLLKQLDFSEKNHVLDVGCGLGGVSRHVAEKCGSQVTGIDMTQEYIEVGNVLSRWLALQSKVSLCHGNALATPFGNETFSGALMVHVGMNIGDKAGLFREVYRLLQPRALFAIYDVMLVGEGKLDYPVPWVTDKNSDNLATPQRYRDCLADAGFHVVSENNRRSFALELFARMREKTKTREKPSPLGLHTIFGKNTGVKVSNLMKGVERGVIAPVEIVAQK